MGDLESARRKVKERELDSIEYTRSKLEIEKLGIELSGQKEKRGDLERLCTELELELAKRQQSHVKFDLPPTENNILALTAKETEEVESGIQQLCSIIEKLSQVIIYAVEQCERTDVDSPTQPDYLPELAQMDLATKTPAFDVDEEDAVQAHDNV